MRVNLVNEDRLYFINLINLQVSVIFSCLSLSLSLSHCGRRQCNLCVCVCCCKEYRSISHSTCTQHWPTRAQNIFIKKNMYKLHINHSIVFNVKWIIAYSEQQHWLKNRSEREKERDEDRKKSPRHEKKKRIIMVQERQKWILFILCC